MGAVEGAVTELVGLVLRHARGVSTEGAVGSAMEHCNGHVWGAVEEDLEAGVIFNRIRLEQHTWGFSGRICLIWLDRFACDVLESLAFRDSQFRRLLWRWASGITPTRTESTH